MEILKFKTSPLSQQDEQKIASLFQQEKIVHKWNIGRDANDTLITISGNQVDPQLVINLLKEAGFDAEFRQVFGAGGGGL
jgi:hypothetical protein